MGKSNRKVVRALVASTGTYVASTEYPCAYAEWVKVEINVTSDAASDVAMVIVEATDNDASTDPATRVWKPLTGTTGAYTAQSIGTPPSGASYDDFGFAVPTSHNIVLTTTPATDADDKIYRSAILYVGSAKAIRAQVRGSAGTPDVEVVMSSFGSVK